MDQPVTFLRESDMGSATPGHAGSLPTDLLNQAITRLRILAVLYAVTFFLAGTLPMLIPANDRHQLLSSPLQWGPQLFAIVMAVVVAATLEWGRLSVTAAMRLGFFFQVASSYSIVLAEFIDTRPLPAGAVPMQMGLSWVAVWTMLFTIVIPSAPRRALLAALASVSAVPVTVALLIAANLSPMRPDPGQFFFWLVFPYILVTIMAWVGARVVYALGTEIKRARELGSYNLVELLGEGGMGQVWRARHRMLARPAAIKLMRGHSRQGDKLSVSAVQRFEREAQAIASLRSPHTVNLFDFGVDDRGVFYYVMELLEGLDADKLVRRYGPLPAPRVIHLLRQVCHSLSEAESRGLVHRDIKPANIFLCRYGEDYDFVKVLDFGIVKAVDDVSTPAGLQTAENVVPGTPAFMAPEQILGGVVDHRTDIYATGCVAYWLLTGQHVFDAPTSIAFFTHHAQSIPKPPSSRSELAIPPALDALVLACLEKSPAARPQSARELSRRLEEIAGSEAWSEQQAREWWERVHP